jgi:3-mercaptopyruvate sulfurtransferase SseA
MNLRTTMRAVVAVAVAGLAGAALAADGPTRAGAPTSGRITLAEFKKAVDAKAVVVLDVRGAEAYANGHIPGSLSRPISTLDSWVAEFQGARKPIVTYCA